MPAIVVEFFGMPGSGKTHLCVGLAPALRDLGWKVTEDPVSRGSNRLWRITRKVPLVAAEYLRSRRSRDLFRSAIAAASSGFRSRFRIAFNILFVRARIASFRSRSGQQLLLHDQGCAQALWSEVWVGSDALKLTPWSQLTDDLGVSFVVVDVRVPMEVAALRTRQRQSRNSPIDGPEQHQAGVERAWRVTEEVRAALRQRSEVAVIGIDGEGGIETTSQLAQFVDAAARSASGCRARR